MIPITHQPDPLNVVPWHKPLTGYDPRKDGADCDHCPMRRWRKEKWAPVPAKRATGGAPKGAFIGEAPAANEVDQGVPFVGESGSELNDALKATGIRRYRWDVDNVISCRALLTRDGKDNYELISTQLKKDKQRGKSHTWEQHPAIHCRPRLDRTLARTPNIVPMGGKAAGAVLGGVRKILGIRGGPTEAELSIIDPRDPTVAHIRIAKVLPTVHPAFVRRARRWRRVFQADLRRAVRYFNNALEWTDPLIHYNPSPAELEHFLAQPSQFWTYDLETDAKEPMQAQIRCMSIVRDATPAERAQGYEDVGVSIAFRSCEMGEFGVLVNKEFYPRHLQGPLVATLRRVFTDGRLWTGWNVGWYDRLIMENRLGVTPWPCMDGIMLWGLAAREMPKSLGVVGSIFCDVTAWKQDNEGTKLAFGARTDLDLWKYCITDSSVTRRSILKIIPEIDKVGQNRTCPARPSITLGALDHRIQSVCAGLTRTGMLIDAVEQQKQEVKLSDEVSDLRAKVLSLHPWRDATFNPASPPQVQRTLYSHKGFDLEPVEWTDSGDPSTGDDCLREHLMAAHTAPEAVEFIRALRTFRSKHKKLTSFVLPLRPRSKGGVLDADGRLRVSWSAHVVVTRRLASSDPMNCFDGNTEVLTKGRGWMTLAALLKGARSDATGLVLAGAPDVEVAQWHKDGSIDFVKPEAWVKRHHTGSMIHIHKKRHIDFLVTPDHRCVVQRKDGSYRVLPARTYPKASHKQLHAGRYSGGTWNPSTAFIRLLCAIQADGTLTQHNYGWAVTLKAGKLRKIARFRALATVLARTGLVEDGFYDRTSPLTARDRQDKRKRPRTAIRLKGIAVDEAAALLGPNKTFGPWLLDLTPGALRKFAREVFFWDGCITRMNHYSSSVKVNAEWVATVLALTGNRPHFRKYNAASGNPNWQVDVLWGCTTSWTAHLKRETVPWDDLVYCLSVPSTFVVVKRSQRIGIIGQCQNWSKDLRAMVVAGPGNVLVGADYDQLEGRIAGARWGMKKYLRAYWTPGIDPHQITMEFAFGKRIWTFPGAPPLGCIYHKKWKAGPWGPGGHWTGEVGFSDYVGGAWVEAGKIGGKFNETRDLSKRFYYGKQYGAGDETVWGLLREAEADVFHAICASCGKGTLKKPADTTQGCDSCFQTTTFINQKLKLTEVAAMSRRFLAANPEMEDGWASEIAFYKKFGYSEEPITGARRFFLDGFKPNEVINFFDQGSAGGLMNLGTIDVEDEGFGSNYAGPGTGIIQQGHDALVLEVLLRDEQRAKDTLEAKLSQYYPHIYDVKFTTEADSGHRWKDV